MRRAASTGIGHEETWRAGGCIWRLLCLSGCSSLFGNEKLIDHRASSAYNYFYKATGSSPSRTGNGNSHGLDRWI